MHSKKDIAERMDHIRVYCKLKKGEAGQAIFDYTLNQKGYSQRRGIATEGSTYTISRKADKYNKFLRYRDLNIEVFNHLITFFAANCDLTVEEIRAYVLGFSDLDL